MAEEYVGVDALLCDACFKRLAGLMVRALASGVPVKGLQIELRSPSGLPLVTPDPAWHNAWERWAELSERRDGKPSELG